MSLINDALKRASQAKPTPPTPTAAEPPLRPVEHRRGSALSLWIWPALLVLVLGLAGWFFMKAWQAARTPTAGGRQVSVLAREAPQTPMPPTPPLQLKGETPVASNLQPVPAPVQGQTLLPSTTTSNASAAPVTSASLEPVKPTFPVVRLQGIFFRAERPSALINAKTAFVGDKVANVKVLAITRETVTVEWNGETKVLSLD